MIVLTLIENNYRKCYIKNKKEMFHNEKIYYGFVN